MLGIFIITGIIFIIIFPLGILYVKMGREKKNQRLRGLVETHKPHFYIPSVKKKTHTNPDFTHIHQASHQNHLANEKAMYHTALQHITENQK